MPCEVFLIELHTYWYVILIKISISSLNAGPMKKYYTVKKTLFKCPWVFNFCQSLAKDSKIGLKNTFEKKKDYTYMSTRLYV